MFWDCVVVVVVCMVCFGSSFAALILDFGYAVGALFVCVICGTGFLDGCVAVVGCCCLVCRFDLLWCCGLSGLVFLGVLVAVGFGLIVFVLVCVAWLLLYLRVWNC